MTTRQYDYLDSNVKIVDVNDPTKQLTFDLSGITSATTRTWIIPDTDQNVGNVVGPASTVDNTIPRFNGTTGQSIQTSSVVIDDTNNMSGVANITLTGTVDGRDVAADGITLDTHVADSTIHFTVASIDHGLIAGLVDDDHTQYALLAGRAGGQSLVGGTAASETLTLESTSNVTKGTVQVLSPLETDDLDARTATTLLVGKSTATKVQLAQTGITTEVQGPLTALEGVGVTGNITVTGTVDGRDVSVDGSTLDSHIADSTIHFTVASIDHGLIAGLVDDDHTQYALLAGRTGGQTLIGGSAASDNLTLSSTSNVTKGNVVITDPLTTANINTTGNITVTGTVDGRDVSVDGSTLDSHIADSTIHFTVASIDHGLIAGLTDDDHPQYALLAGRTGGQTLIGGSAASENLILESTSNVTKGVVQVLSPLEVDDLDAQTATTLLVGKSTATKVQLAKTGVTTEAQGPLTALEGVGVTGNITVTGTVDGRDVSVDGSTLDSHVAATVAHGATGAVVGTTNTQTLTNKTFGDNLDMNSNFIVNLANPSLATDAANKAYVDSVAGGIDVKASVVAATTLDLNSNTSISGTITYNATGGTSTRGQITATLVVSDTFTVDGVTFGVANDGSRLLLKNQTAGAQNGIWVTTISGTSLTLDRATDFDTDAEVTSGAFTFIEQGTVNADTGWLLTTDNPITIGGASGTALTWAQFSAAGQVTGANVGTGDGWYRDKTGTTLNFKTLIAGSTKLSVTNNTNDLTVDVAEANISHSALAGLANDDHTQYALLAGRAGGQALVGGSAASESLTLESTSNVTKGTITVLDPLIVDDLDARTATTLLLGKTTATKIELAGTGITTEAQGPLTALEGVGVTGNITVTGTVDGRDVATDGSTLDSHVADSTIHFTVASIDHGLIAGLVDDDHTQYALLAGRAGGQALVGGTAASDTLTLESTSNVTKGVVQILDPLEVDDVDARTATTLLLGKLTATKIELANTGVTTEAQGPLTALEGVGVTGNITVTGTVDGRDVSVDGSTLDSHVADSTIHFTVASIDHGLIAGLVDDDHTQYALLAGRAGGQSLVGGTAASETLTLESTSNVTKGTVQVLSPLEADDLDARTATTLLLGKLTATKVELANTGVTTEAQGPLTALEGLGVTGNITVTGTVDGRDVATDGTTLDNHVASTAAHGATGAVVGTTNVQTLTNKTIDTASNTLTIDAGDIASGTLTVPNGGTGATTLLVDSWLRGNGTSAIAAVKMNIGAATGPTANDDTGSGYEIGSRWLDTTADKEYVCLDATSTAAVWVETTAGASGGEANTASNVGTGAGWYKQKAGVDLEFKSLIAGSTKLSITTNVNDLTVDVAEANISHSAIAGLANDDHTQYALLAGRAGGQSLVGGTAASESLTLESTSNVTKGNVVSLDPFLCDDIDANTATTLLLGSVTATKLELGATGIVTQTMGPSVFSNYLELTDITAPANPGAGLGRLYKKTGATGLFWLPDAAGAEVDLTGGGAEVDDQLASATATTTTTSTTYVDLNSMTLTTSNTVAKNYMVSFKCTVQTSANQTSVWTILNVNGTDVTATESEHYFRFGTANTCMSNLTLTSGTGSGIIIKVRWRADTGATATITNRNLVIYGVS